MRSCGARKAFTDDLVHGVLFKGAEWLFHVLENALEVAADNAWIGHGMKEAIVSKRYVLLNQINALHLGPVKLGEKMSISDALWVLHEIIPDRQEDSRQVN